MMNYIEIYLSKSKIWLNRDTISSQNICFYPYFLLHVNLSLNKFFSDIKLWC